MNVIMESNGEIARDPPFRRARCEEIGDGGAKEDTSSGAEG